MSLGTRLYIGGVKYNVERIDLKQFFWDYEKLTEISIKNGRGYVDFDNQDSADRAVQHLHGKNLMGRRITLEYESRNPIPGFGEFDSRTEWKLIITNLAESVTWQDLSTIMAEAGRVTYVDAHTPIEGVAYVDYATEEDMRNAIEMYHRKRMGRQKVKVREDKVCKRLRNKSRRRFSGSSCDSSPPCKSQKLMDQSVSSDESLTEISSHGLFEVELAVDFLTKFFVKNGIDTSSLVEMSSVLNRVVEKKAIAVRKSGKVIVGRKS
uniref:RRM domain-containing protein n=1 Tax=Strigamia maritima TaxID=126957 RepID=T1IL61_STRMM